MSLNQKNTLSKEEIDKIADEAWLNIKVNETTLCDMLSNIPVDLQDKPHLWYTFLLSRPEYFHTICKEILNVNLMPYQVVVLQQLWKHKFPMLIASRGFSKSFILAVYAILRCLLIPGRKVIVCGSAFRQSKIIFEYIVGIWNNAPILRDIMGTSSGPRYGTDRWLFKFRESTVTALPIGNGDTIRGMRAHDILTDEFSSGNLEVFETVIAGFAAVRSNPVDSVKYAASAKFKKMMGIIEDGPDESGHNDNQIVISGTAYYSFNHFYDYWQRWKRIILSKGDKKKLMEILNDSVIPKGFNWKDYAIIRIPYDLLPEGYVDEAQISRTKATSDPSRFNNEYGAVFSKDSNGFFRRAMIESCVVNKPIITAGGHEVLPYNASLYGNLQKRYVFGIDPASEHDNLAINIIELNGEYRKIIYSWTTNRKTHSKLVQEKLVRETDYFGYCARKIRTLMARFPTEHIGIDTQGGGVALMEALHDIDKLREGEVPIYPIIDPNKKRDSDNFVGLHIIYPINFASADWTANANYNLRKDLGEKNILFPAFDAALLASVSIENDNSELQFDTLEECMLDIEELKDELASIVMTSTPSGRERWDTPDKLTDGKKGTMRKDRYSALLIANSIGREIYRNPTIEFPDTSHGGFSGYTGKKDHNSKDLFWGQPWLNQLYDGVYD